MVENEPQTRLEALQQALLMLGERLAEETARREAADKALAAEREKGQQERIRRKAAEIALLQAQHVAQILVAGAGYDESCNCQTCWLRREYPWLRADPCQPFKEAAKHEI